jgi:signal transduction histidine kinase
LCIICFITSFIQHFIYILSSGTVDFTIFITFDVILSACLAVAVLFANKLVNYINRLNYQREVLSKQLLSTVLRTEERSRSQFAKELHDGMGPLLSSAKMSLSAISVQNMSKEQQEILHNTRFLIDEAIRSVREISSNMSPQILNDFGLAQGVQSFLSRIQSLHTIDIVFDTNLQDERFDSNIEVVLYRVICELINNSLKHSQCTLVEVALMQQGSYLKLRYSDNGCGFDPDKTMRSGMGLSNITSRIDSLSGELHITSATGKGMSAVASINTASDESNVLKQRKRRWRERRLK